MTVQRAGRRKAQLFASLEKEFRLAALIPYISLSFKSPCARSIRAKQFTWCIMDIQGVISGIPNLASYASAINLNSIILAVYQS